LVPLTLLAGEFWETKPPSEWSERQVYALLTDSPWAHQAKVTLALEKPYEHGPPTWKELKVPGSGPGRPEQPVGSPVGGIGAPKPKVPREAQLLIRWSSASPVREALVRYKAGQSTAPAVSEEPEKFYMIEILGVPAIVAFSGIQVLQDELYRSAGLLTKSGRTIRPESVYATPQGEFLGIWIRFPKTEPLTLADKYVDLVGKTAVFSFKKRFELRSMLRGGHLEL
jgi:hypothetical protein